jgi:hypothetical protein
MRGMADEAPATVMAALILTLPPSFTAAARLPPACASKARFPARASPFLSRPSQPLFQPPAPAAHLDLLPRRRQVVPRNPRRLARGRRLGLLLARLAQRGGGGCLVVRDAGLEVEEVRARSLGAARLSEAGTAGWGGRVWRRRMQLNCGQSRSTAAAGQARARNHASTRTVAALSSARRRRSTAISDRKASRSWAGGSAGMGALLDADGGAS